jgi:hypothetical protein
MERVRPPEPSRYRYRLSTMRTFRTFRYLLIGLTLVTAAACGTQHAIADPPGPGSHSGRSSTADVLVRVSWEGGFVGPNLDYSRIPAVSVYDNGDVVTPGPVPAIYPAPALPNLRVRHLAGHDANRLADLATVAFRGGTDFGTPPIADASTTVFRLSKGGQTRTVRVYALAENSTAGNGLTRAQRANRDRMNTLLSALTNLPRTLGTRAAGRDEAYRPTALAALSTHWTEAVPSGTSVVAWPGAALPGAPLPGATRGSGLTCTLTRGPALTPVLAAATRANTNTLWSSRGSRWSLTFRPLLPEESSCADLGSAR